MTNPTSNFGWQMPTSTDLVTDLPADFEVFGQAVDTDFVDLLGGTTGQVLSKTSATDLDFTWINNDTGDITGVTAGTGISGGGTSGTVTVTNSMATEITAKGDLIAGTGNQTFDNLPVGTNNQILVADSTEATGLKWATPAAAASGLTLITRNTFSNVASVQIDSIFSSTYKSYMVVIEKVFGASGSDDFQMQMRYGATSQAAGYYGASGYATYNSASFSNIQVNNGSIFTLMLNTGSSSAAGNTATLFFTHVGQTSEAPTWSGTGMDYVSNNAHFIGGTNGNQETYTGLRFFTSSSNISGTVAVYGMAAA